MSVVINQTGPKGFLLWLKANMPREYATLMKAQKPKLAGLGSTGLTNVTYDPNSAPTTAATPAWLNSVSQILQGGAQVYLTAQQLRAQQKVMDLQLERARQGLAPLNIDPMQYGLTPQVGVGLSPDTKKLLMYGGGALLVILLLRSFK